MYVDGRFFLSNQNLSYICCHGNVICPGSSEPVVMTGVAGVTLTNQIPDSPNSASSLMHNSVSIFRPQIGWSEQNCSASQVQKNGVDY